MHSMKGTCALAATAAALLIAPGAQGDPTVSSDTSSTQYGYVDARSTNHSGVQTKIQLLGQRSRSAAADAGTDTASLVIEQTKCIAGVRHWRRFEAHGVKGVTYDSAEPVQATLKGPVAVAGSESTAPGCDATKPAAGTAKPIAGGTIQVDAKWSQLESGGDGTEIEDEPSAPPPSGDPLAPPDLPPPSAPDPNHACLGVLGGVGGSTSGWRGSLAGAQSLPVYAQLAWTSLTPGHGTAQTGYSSYGYWLMAGTDCRTPQRAVKSRARRRAA
jgi:hypothetical protein